MVSYTTRATVAAATVAAAAGLSWPAAAQQHDHARHDAAAPAAQTAASAPSALSTHRRYADEPLIPWKQANELVGRIGGWQAYAREAAANAASPASAPAAGRSGHSGHRP